MPTQIERAEQMVAQMRLIKPSISGEVGTPERLIIDVVAQALSENSIDLIGLENALNVDTKFGSNLTNFVSLFGFNRQKPTQATGFVIFSRNSVTPVNILIPAGTIVKSTEGKEGILAEFVTTASVTMQAGTKETALTPIRATTPGSNGNVAANTITIMSLAPVLGVTAVTNPAATEGGNGEEDDNSLKTRFKETVFRNMAGTFDQLLALAVSTAFSQKAAVIGPISRYQEYVQVPTNDDSEKSLFLGPGSEELPGVPYNHVAKASIHETAGEKKLVKTTTALEVKTGEAVTIWYIEGTKPPKKASMGTISEIISSTELKTSSAAAANYTNVIVLIEEKTAANYVNLFTAALSDNPYAKEIYTGIPVFVSDSISGIAPYFFREDVDYEFNYPALLQGDTLRAVIAQEDTNPLTEEPGKNQPNITFINVYKGAETAIKAIGPETVVLTEYSYVSSSSRNSVKHNVTNCVDVYVDGVNEVVTETIFATTGTKFEFHAKPEEPFYVENFRRDGEPTKRPLNSNLINTLFQQPITSLPSQIIIGESKYYLGTHYWLVHDVSENLGSIRARDGIEWSATTPGDLGHSSEGPPTEENPEPEYTGKLYSAFSQETVELNEYGFNQNISELQAAIEAARQVTTDVLVHAAKVRYFKLDLTVVYSPTATQSVVNENIFEAVEQFFGSRYFGNVIRLTDILTRVSNVSGVENVRWSNDVPHNNSLARVYETQQNGRPLLGAYLERTQWGSKVGKRSEHQELFLVGQPTGGKFKFKKGTEFSKALAFSGVTAAEIKTALEEAAIGYKEIEVTEVEHQKEGVTGPLTSFLIKFITGEKEKPQHLAEVVNSIGEPLEGEEYIYDSDYFLRDDELPQLAEAQSSTSFYTEAGAVTTVADTLPGLIIRERAQNVWQKN